MNKLKTKKIKLDKEQLYAKDISSITDLHIYDIYQDTIPYSPYFG